MTCERAPGAVADDKPTFVLVINSSIPVLTVSVCASVCATLIPWSVLFSNRSVHRCHEANGGRLLADVAFI